jgi:hypothetical protein
MLLCPANTFAAGWAETPIILRFTWGRIAFFLLCLMAVVAHAASAPTTLRLSEYQKQDWQVEDGLPENYVRMITQRPDGVLLLATLASSCVSAYITGFRVRRATPGLTIWTSQRTPTVEAYLRSNITLLLTMETPTGIFGTVLLPFSLTNCLHSRGKAYLFAKPLEAGRSIPFSTSKAAFPITFSLVTTAPVSTRARNAQASYTSPKLTAA